ncbi:hypothetical protein QJS10_CPA07g00416 [Acorus calamus]|uniref:Uncharacterized protein n=1 Tax=Acorus calamus TaxID=4465 RepID=A0AAV9EH90_ACOCL|nr:hypothetical protein QJS10_CPA07g00416 [Acorus calamus]
MGKLNSSTSDDRDGGDSFCSVISDAKLLAWGHCGDSYSRSKSVSFDELLFTSNDHDIIVHAFLPRNEIEAVAESAPECGIGRGKWVDWGPGLNGRVETEEIGWKRWFRSFLVEVEAWEVEGSVGVKFPVVPSFPRLAEVVSFSIRDLILKFLDTSKKDSHKGSISLYQEDMQCLSVKAISDSEMLMDCGSDCTGMEYKISRLFSSSSYRLVGIVLTSVEPASNSKSEESPRCLTKTLVVIVMVCPWGLQWVSSVKIQDEYLAPGGWLGWVDFQFVENFLVGLNSSGVTCIWCGTSGEIVACLSVLRGSPLLGPSQSFVTGDLMAATTQHDSEVGERKVPPECYVCVKRLFRKLIVASDSFLLAVVDEYGIIYVIRVDDYISEKYRDRMNFMLPFQHRGLGVLAGWKIAGSEIGGQKVYPHLSHTGGLNFVSSPRENLACSDQVGSVEPSMKIRDLYMSGFTGSQVEGHKDPCSGSQLPPMRKVFLPSDKCCEEDYVFFSPLGITRLFKRYNINEEKIFKIVNTPLQLTPSAERDLNTCYELRSDSLFQMEHPFVGEGEAVGCSFQGCFYLVSQDDLSIILPSVSVANCIHLEAIRYWIPNFLKGGSRYEQFTKESRMVLEPWKIEVLDRTLLYEGPEVAEKICLENGEIN